MKSGIPNDTWKRKDQYWLSGKSQNNRLTIAMKIVQTERS